MPRTIGAFMMREMQTSYGRSPGGYIWALLEPLGGIVMFTLVIASGFRVRNPALGDNFPLFFATGILVLGMTMGIAGKVSMSLMYSKRLLSYPGVTFVDALIARFLVTGITQLMVFYILIFGLFAVFDISGILRVEWIAVALFLSLLFGFGLGVINAFLMGVWSLWKHIWAIFTRPLFIVSTTFYTLEQIPREWQGVALWNPLIHIIGFMRRGFYAGYDAAWASVVYVAGLGGAFLVLGLLFLRRYHRYILTR